jgi:predicted PurR-regulated permease PerM
VATTVQTRLEQNLGWFILIVLAVGCSLVMWPFLSSMLWAAILCFSMWPLYRRLLAALGNRRTLAALVMSLGLSLVILVPFAVIGLTLADQFTELSGAAKKWVEAGPPSPPEWLNKVPMVGKRAVEQWQTLAQNPEKLTEIGRRLLQPLSTFLLGFGVAVGSGVMHLALSLIIGFFLFRNGTWAGEQLSATFIRIGGDRAARLLELAGSTVRGVVYGVLGTALFQAMLAGIGFLIAGVPGAGVLALITLFVSVIPMGPPLVCLPAALWLAHQDQRGWAVFIMIWGIGVGSVDNFIKPWLISRGSTTPFLLIMFGVLGGAIAFGFIGVFLGPTLLAVGYRVFQEWLAQRSAAAAATRDDDEFRAVTAASLQEISVQSAKKN